MQLRRESRRDASPTSAALNPSDARNTDPCAPAGTTGRVNHNYACNGPAPGNLWFRWIHGSPVAARDNDPRIQVMEYNEDTYVLRQNICVDWRGAFTYLLFGNDGALLIDTGATADPRLYPLRSTVDGLVARWASIRGRQEVSLTVVFTSAECLAGNGGAAQFAGRAHCRVAPHAVSDLQQFYRLLDHDTGSGVLDLGGRILHVLRTPGTHRDGLSFYDTYTKHIFTGDLLFPGRIEIANEHDFLLALERLQRWKETHPVKWILGNRIDMQFLPGRPYSRFATYKPYERELQLLPSAVDAALDAARTLQGRPGVVARADFWLLNDVGPDERPSSFPKDLPDLRAPRPV